MELPRPVRVSRNYRGKSASDSNYVTVSPCLSQLSGYISEFSSGLMALLKFRRETRVIPARPPLSYLPAYRCESGQLIRLPSSNGFTSGSR